MSLTIEAGKFYKTRSGRKARIYALDGAGDKCIHGAIFECNPKQWHPVVWFNDGKSGGRLQESGNDIVAPWTDPPVVDWSKFPAHIVAVARDGRGRKMGFTAIPELREEYGGWRYTEPVGYHQYIRLACDEKLTFTGDWRDSLAVRPGCEEAARG